MGFSGDTAICLLLSYQKFSPAGWQGESRALWWVSATTTLKFSVVSSDSTIKVCIIMTIMIIMGLSSWVTAFSRFFLSLYSRPLEVEFGVLYSLKKKLDTYLVLRLYPEEDHEGSYNGCQVMCNTIHIHVDCDYFRGSVAVFMKGAFTFVSVFDILSCFSC